MVAEQRRTSRGADGADVQQPSGDERPPVAPPPPPPTSSVPTIQVRRLIAESSGFLGCPSHVAAGALFDYGPDDEMTVDDARQAVESWLSSPVKEG